MPLPLLSLDIVVCAATAGDATLWSVYEEQQQQHAQSYVGELRGEDGGVSST